MHEARHRTYRIARGAPTRHSCGMDHWLPLLGAGVLAGGMNALAGGGSFVTLAVLIASGLPSVNANASSTVALYPAGIASAWVYRRGIGRVCGVPAPADPRRDLARWARRRPSPAGDAKRRRLRSRPPLAAAAGDASHHARSPPGTDAAGSLPGWPVNSARSSGAARHLWGLLRRCRRPYDDGSLGLLEAADVKALNPPRTLFVTAANTVAVMCFALAGAVRWPEAILVGTGAVCGGYGGAHLGKRLPPKLVRAATVALAIGMTLAFFVRAYVR